MLKKVGVVAAAAIGLSMIATPAIATADPLEDTGLPGVATTGEYPAAVDTVALGYGTTSLVSGIYTGIAIAPLIAISFDD